MRRQILTAIGAVLLTGCASTGASSNSVTAEGRNDGLADLTIEMNVDIQEGIVMVSLFKGGDAYAGGAPIANGGKPAAKTVTFTIEGLEPGEYGIKAFHDVNGNGELDANVLGMPTEPFAFSNNAPANFGPAKWEDAVFTVTSPATIHKMEIQ